jgi:ATP phosphoribosyltransferase
MVETRNELRLAIPSDGALYEPTNEFLRASGMPNKRISARGYTGKIAAVEGVSTLFQRASDIPGKVEDGTADCGIVGLDRFLEYHQEGGDSLVVIEDLRFGGCELALAVPETWLDVTTTADLGDLALEFREKGRELRVATKYPQLTQRFLYSKGINYLTMIPSSGTLEVAPAIGQADLIADVTATGTTLRENRLKTLMDGTILRSQSCLIVNRKTLAGAETKLKQIKAILERAEGYLRAQDYCSIAANVQGSSQESIATRVLDKRELSGIEGPTIAPVYSAEGGDWYSVTVLVEKVKVLDAVEHMREFGGSGITVTQPTYLFFDTCLAYQRLTAAVAGIN